MQTNEISFFSDISLLTYPYIFKYNLYIQGGYILKFLIDLIKGSLIGIANIVPGLSGGTLAVVMGIYDKLINSIGDAFKKPISVLKELWIYILGIGFGLIIGIFGISYLIENFEIQTSSLFVGLIIGAIPLISKQINLKTIHSKDKLIFCLMFLLVATLPFLSILGITAGSNNPIIFFLIGVISAATMVIPGISGSMVLMAIGYYDSVLLVVKDSISLALEINFSALVPNLVLLVPLAVGILLGIVLIAKFITWMFLNHKQITTCAILGLISASPIVIFSELNYSNVSIVTILVSLMTFGIGLFIAHLLNKFEENKKS